MKRTPTEQDQYDAAFPMFCEDYADRVAARINARRSGA